MIAPLESTDVTVEAAAKAAEAKARRAARKAARAAQPPPERDSSYDGLSLPDLRQARTDLGNEETRVSYWRRLLQARLDQVVGPDDHKALSRLRGVLDDHGQSSRRLAMLPVVKPEDAAPLPNLAVLWETTPGTEADHELMIARLTDAESDLSSYRRSLHERLDAATGELISRYRDEPALALQALPLRQQRSA